MFYDILYSPVKTHRGTNWHYLDAAGAPQNHKGVGGVLGGKCCVVVGGGWSEGSGGGAGGAAEGMSGVPPWD